MKLSEECANMDYRGRHSLIQKIKALEEENARLKETFPAMAHVLKLEQAAHNWLLVENLPFNASLQHTCTANELATEQWHLSVPQDHYCAETPAGALQAYWHSLQCSLAHQHMNTNPR